MNAEAWQSLLEVSSTILQHRDVRPLFQSLAPQLRSVLPFDFMSLVLYDVAGDCMRLHVLEANAPAQTPRLELPVDQSPAGWVLRNQQPLVVDDVAHETRWPAVMEILRANGVTTCCFLPLTTAHRKIGALSFGYVRAHQIDEAELEFMGRVSAQVAVAVDNSLNADALARERDRLRVLLDITNAMVAQLELGELFASITACLRNVVPHEYSSLALHEPGAAHLVIHALEFELGSGRIQQDARVPIEGSPSGVAFTSGQPVRFEAGSFSSEVTRALESEGLRSGVCIPLPTRNRVLGTLNLASVRENAFSPEDVDFLSQVAAQAAIAIENAQAFREIERLKNKLAEEKLYLEDEIRSERNFGEIIGDSPAFRKALHQVETVAPTNATVLILGETGTGKELIARSVHELSARRERTFARLNCAAIPTGLLESELFGHEKGAFTGAIAQRIGRFELADGGTLFLDEVGDIPLELQPKLLRALQEQEFERLGSTRTIKVDVRVIAATNRDLTRMVAEQQFRIDLYYRLNVFPLPVPPLRERVADIPMLVRYFAQKFSRRMNRHIETIPAATLSALAEYSWPGNVRELENLIERAVILSSGTSLDIPLSELRPDLALAPSATLATAERQHIRRVLEETGWQVDGPNGAAVRLGMKRTTLQSRIKKLGIQRTVPK
ncbi:MAG: sigma 54-interacting transcriptional regulator [Bryobacteraceae bacterium]|jgi:formate hydrogenlyase transcriptional activator